MLLMSIVWFRRVSITTVQNCGITQYAVYGGMTLGGVEKKTSCTRPVVPTVSVIYRPKSLEKKAFSIDGELLHIHPLGRFDFNDHHSTIYS